MLKSMDIKEKKEKRHGKRSQLANMYKSTDASLKFNEESKKLSTDISR